MTTDRSKAFKYRGASNALLKHIDELRSGSDSNQDPKELWVFTHSSGNFAQAVSVLSFGCETPIFSYPYLSHDFGPLLCVRPSASSMIHNHFAYAIAPCRRRSPVQRNIYPPPPSSSTQRSSCPTPLRRVNEPE